MKIAIYGCGETAQIIKKYVDTLKDIQIKYFILSETKESIFDGYPVYEPEEVVFEDIDYIVISSDIFSKSMKDELMHRASSYRENIGKVIDRESFLEMIYVDDSQYRTVTVNGGISYVYRREDSILGPWMRYSKENHSHRELTFLLSFVKENTNFKDDGYFLDIGANIGTTSICVKKINPDFKVISFEPGQQNYDLLRVNCILNKEEGIRAEHIGLGSEVGKRHYYYRIDNPGGSEVCDAESEQYQETVIINTLDYYLNEKGIRADDISFIWMDTEGFESEVIIGSKKTLKLKAIPLVHEFNPKYYKKKGTVTEYLDIMNEAYSYFFDVRKCEGQAPDIMKINQLERFLYEKNDQTDIFFFD